MERTFGPTLLQTWKQKTEYSMLSEAMSSYATEMWARVRELKSEMNDGGAEHRKQKPCFHIKSRNSILFNSIYS
jgi:hypothetical protein